MTLWNPHTWPHAAGETAFVLSCLAFVVPLILLIRRKIVGRLTPRAVRWHLVASGMLLLLLNPFVQLLTLSHIDSALRARWEDLARERHLIGMDAQQVQELFGEPCESRAEAPTICGPSGCAGAGNQYTAWDYAPLPLFWLSHGGHFKVFFERGHATGFKRGE